MAGQRLPTGAIARLVAHGVPEAELREMRVVTAIPGRWLPPLFRAGAMTFGPYVLFRLDRYDPETPAGLALIAHESGHITQWRELGVWRFLVNYASGLLSARFAHTRHPMERPLNEWQRELLARLEAESA